MKYTSTGSAEQQTHVPPGDYLLTIVEAKEGYSSKGSPMLSLRCEVESEPVSVFEYLVASVAWKIDQFVVALGGSIEEGKEIDLDPASLEGKQAWATLKLDTYEGRTSNKVAAWIVKDTPKDPQPEGNDPF